MSARPAVALRDVRFRYAAAPSPVLDGFSLACPIGFTGIVGANGSGKSTLLRLLVGELAPDAGHVEGTGDALLCAQRTDAVPEGLDELLADGDAHAGRLRARLDLPGDAPWRWDTLSHGERKRCQLAVALRREPSVLALDEPTNHVDGATRTLLLDALGAYAGVGVVVSHDRALLDALCVQCVWLDGSEARVFPGGYGDARALRDADLAMRTAERDRARRTRDRLTHEEKRRRAAAAGADRRRSKRGIGAKDADARARIDLARVSGQDGAAGRRQRQLQGRVAQARDAVDAAFVRDAPALGVDIATAPSRRDALLDLPAGTLALHDTLSLDHPDLRLRPTDRIALTGPNGAGKSRLLEALRPHWRVDESRLLWMPQEIGTTECAALLASIAALPSDALGSVLQLVARLGSDAERVRAAIRDGGAPSPGELRKLWLASALAHGGRGSDGSGVGVEAIILDEPTNHLDLPSVECLAAAFANARCLLFLVSHDVAFLDALATRRWRIEDHGGARRLIEEELPDSAATLP